MRAAYVLPLLGFLLIAFALAVLLLRPDTRRVANDNRPLPAFAVPSLDGQAQFDSAAIKGPAVLNVFASWCAPCLVEHPLLTALATEHSIPLYGIAWRDTPEDAARWLARHGNPFRIVGVDTRGEMTVPLALTGVPETLVIDAHGRIRRHYHAPLTPQQIAREIVPLIESLKAEAR